MAKGYWKVTLKNETGIASDVVHYVYASSKEEAIREGFALYRKRIDTDHGFDYSRPEDVITKVELIENLG